MGVLCHIDQAFCGYTSVFKHSNLIKEVLYINHTPATNDGFDAKKDTHGNGMQNKFFTLVINCMPSIIGPVISKTMCIVSRLQKVMCYFAFAFITKDKPTIISAIILSQQS